jgi:hypothetical protein
MASWVALADVSDPEGYKLYVAENAKAFRKYGARFSPVAALQKLLKALPALALRRLERYVCVWA